MCLCHAHMQTYIHAHTHTHIQLRKQLRILVFTDRLLKQLSNDYKLNATSLRLCFIVEQIFKN